MDMLFMSDGKCLLELDCKVNKIRYFYHIAIKNDSDIVLALNRPYKFLTF